MLPSMRNVLSSTSFGAIAHTARALLTTLDVAASQSVPAQIPLPSSSYSTAAVAAEPASKFYNVPAGHINSDLSSSSCHIGLGRRRDLTLRQDLRLCSASAELTLADVFKSKKVIVVGFPGGKICTEKHLPGFVHAASALREKGVDNIVCVSVGDPGELELSLKAAGLSVDDMFKVYQDKDAGFVRLLGLDLGDPDCGQGPKCQRYAAIVDDGILLKLCVEKSPADLSVTDISSISKLWEKFYS